MSLIEFLKAYEQFDELVKILIRQNESFKNEMNLQNEKLLAMKIL